MKVTITLKFDIDDSTIKRDFDGWNIEVNKSLMNKVADVIDEHVKQGKLIKCNIGTRFRCR